MRIAGDVVHRNGEAHRCRLALGESTRGRHQQHVLRGGHVDRLRGDLRVAADRGVGDIAHVADRDHSGQAKRVRATRRRRNDVGDVLRIGRDIDHVGRSDHGVGANAGARGVGVDDVTERAARSATAALGCTRLAGQVHRHDVGQRLDVDVARGKRRAVVNPSARGVGDLHVVDRTGQADLLALALGRDHAGQRIGQVKRVKCLALALVGRVDLGKRIVFELLEELGDVVELTAGDTQWQLDRRQHRNLVCGDRCSTPDGGLGVVLVLAVRHRKAEADIRAVLVLGL